MIPAATRIGSSSLRKIVAMLPGYPAPPFLCKLSQWPLSLGVIVIGGAAFLAVRQRTAAPPASMS